MPIDGNILLGVAFDPASYSNAQRQLQNLSRRATVDLKVNHAPLGRINADLHEFDKSLQAANARVLAFGASTGAVYGIGRAFTEITKSFINIEAKFKSIQVVLNSTTAVFENFKGSIFAIGRDTGKSFDEVTDAAQELVRQGLKISETLQRTSDAMILSRQSGLSASEAVTSLTAALNTFNQEALTSTQVINKLANVDTNFAVSQKDLIDAISRSGSAAQDAGVQFDKLLSLTTSLQQTTARGGAVIGNALKSIFTRVQRSTTLEALEEFNIQTKDLQGNILSADVLLQNLAKTYKTLSTAEKSALSEQVAGIQQINQLKALLADLARANSVYSQALKTSSSSVNEAIDRNKSLNETLKATLNATKLNALEFSETVGKLALAPALKLPLGSANALFDIFKDKDQDSKGTGQKIGEGILRGIGSVLSGPGLVLATAIITNTLKELGRFTLSVVSDYSSLNNKTKEQINVQHAISQILSDGNNKYAARLAAAKSIKEQEAAIRLIMLEQNNIVARKSAMYAQPVRNIVSSGGDVTREGAFKLPKKAAGGYLPVYEEYQDIQRGVGGASRAAKPKVIPNFNFGGGKRGTIVANTDEYIVPNYAGGDGSAIFNPQMVARHGLPLGARKINAAIGYLPNFAELPDKAIYRHYFKQYKKLLRNSDVRNNLSGYGHWDNMGKYNKSTVLYRGTGGKEVEELLQKGNFQSQWRDSVENIPATFITGSLHTSASYAKRTGRAPLGFWDDDDLLNKGSQFIYGLRKNLIKGNYGHEIVKTMQGDTSTNVALRNPIQSKDLRLLLGFNDSGATTNNQVLKRLKPIPFGYLKEVLGGAAGGFVPNYNTLLGSGDYGSFYDLNRKFKGVDIGKKVFNANIGGRSGDPYLKQAYTEKHITDEFIAAKVLENLSKSGQLPPNVSAPQIFGTLEGALKNKSIYKQVVHGKTGGDLSDRFKTEVYKKKNPSAEDWARSDGGEFFAGSIASFLQNHLTSNLGIEPTDLHAGNYMMTPALSRQLGMFISTNPKKAKAIGEGSQEDFEKFFLPILKQKDNGLSIFDSGELRSSKDLRKMAGLAGGFIPNYADNLLTDHESFTRLEKLLGRVMGFNLVPTSLEENGKKFKITDEELRKLKLKGRTFDTTGNFSKSIENGEAFDPLFSPKSVGNLLTRPREFNIDKYKETKIATGLQESHKITDLFKAAGITPSADPILLKQQIQDLASSKFGKNNFIYKGVNGLQGNQVYPPEMFDLNAAAHYKDLFIQRGIEPTRGNLADQFYNEFRVDVVGGRKGVFGSIPLLKQKVEYLGGKTMSGKPTFRSKFNQHIEKYNLDFLKNPIQAFRALKNAYSSINSIDPAKRAGVSFGVDAFPDGAIELNPSNKTGISGSAGSNLFSSLLTARGLRKASKENVNYFTERGKGILGLSGEDQAKEFRKFNRELLEFQKYDQFGYLKTAKNLNNLGFGITVGKGRAKQQIGGLEAAGLFKRLGFSEGYIPNFAPNRDLQRKFTEQFYKAKRSLQPEERFIKSEDPFDPRKKGDYQSFFSGLSSIPSTPTTVSGSINAITSRAPDDVTRRQLLRLSKEFDYGVGPDRDRDKLAATLRILRKDKKTETEFLGKKYIEDRIKGIRQDAKEFTPRRDKSDFLFRGVGIHEITNLRRLGQVTSLGESNADNKLGTFITSSFGKAAGFGAATLKDSGQGYVLALDKKRILGRPTAESIFGSEEKNTIKAGRITKDDVLGIVDLKTRQIRSLQEFSAKNDLLSRRDIKLSDIRKGINSFGLGRPSFRTELISYDAVKSKFEKEKLEAIEKYDEVLKSGLIFGRPAGQEGLDKIKGLRDAAAEDIKPANLQKSILREVEGNRQYRRNLLLDAINNSAEGGKDQSLKLFRLRQILKNPDQDILNTSTRNYAGGFVPNFNNPLISAIARERAAGLPLSQIRVENHPSLISNLNPGGLAVTNQRDEPAGITQGISRALKEGRDPKKYGAAKGLIPNFAPSFFPDPTFTEGTVKALGMTGNVSPASRAKIKDFTTGIKLSEQDLLLPTQDLRKKIQASITQAFKIDPRFVSEAFEKGAENIADSFVKAQKTAMIKAYQKNLKAGQDDYVRQELVSGVTDKINRQSGFFGGFRNNKIIKGVENSPEYKKLSNEAKLSTSRELNNLAFDNSEKRGAKLQSRALTASFGIPVATGALLSQLNPNDPKSKKFAGIAEGVSTGLSVAAIGGFSPLAVGAGLVLGGGSIASSLAKSRRKSPEQLSEELTNARGKFESSRNAVLGTFQGQDALKEAIEKGSSLGQVRQLSRQITDSISGIEESSLRNKVIAAKTDEERASVIDEINKVGIQKVSRTGLASKLEEAVGPNRGLLSDITGRTKNIVLKPQDVKDIGSLVAGALPLKFDADGKINSKQLTGLQELNKKGDFNIDEVEKVLGSLKLSRESKNQLNQFTIGDQKAIAKDAVERQLSVAALDKNNEGLVKFNNLLLRVGKTLDTLSSNLDFKFKIQNINTAGIRDRAISGASQSLGGISEFLSPELRNKQESLIAGTQIENQRISTINEAATGWVKSLRDLENTVPAALKGNDDGQGGEGYSAKGEPLKREFREILTKVIANGQSDPVSAGLEGLKELKNLNAKFDKSNDPNGKLKDAVLKFTQNLTQNISAADAVAANSKASLDQTTKINELIISLQKSQNFLGGGTFESSKDLDFSKIQSSSRLRRQFKDDLTNPLKDRIYKSRGDSFDDFFQGKQIDEKAETARRASNLGTLASGSLQLSQLGLLDKEGTQKARLEVAAAEKAQLENQLNKLEEIGQTSGDFNLLDSIRNIRKSGIVNDAAATRSLKQVPLLAEEGGGDPLSKLAELSGPLGDLSKNIVNLNSNFQTGVQGDFTELSKQAYAAAKELFDLSIAAQLLKDTAENEKQAKNQLDKSNLIKDKQTKITALEQKRANLEISSVKDLETDTQFQKRLEPSDAVKIGRKIGSFFTADDNQFEVGLPALNLLPGAKTLEQKYSSRFKKNLSSAGVELSPQDLLGDSGRIQDVIGRTKQVNDPKSGKSSIDLIKTIRDKFPGQSPEVIRSLVATRTDSFQNSDEFQKGLSGKLSSEGQALVDRLLSIDTAMGKFSSSISELTNTIAKETAELKSLEESGKSRGLIPNYSGGLSKSFLQEKRDIMKGVGGARPGDSPYITHLAGVGPAVVNTGEKIIRNFAGGGKDAVFNRKMMNFAGGLSFPIYDGKEKMNLSDNRAPGIYENGKLISASAPTQKQNSFTRPKNAYERNIGSVLANAELNSQGQRVSIVGSKYGAGYSQFDKGGGFGKYRNSTDYINSEIAKGNPINPENFKPVYADEDFSNSLTANPVNSSGIRPARTIPLKTIAETTKDQNEYSKKQIIEAKLNNSIRTPAKYKQFVESLRNGSKSNLSDFAGVTEDAGTSSDFFGNKFKDRSTEFNKNFLKEGDNGYVSLRDKMDDSFSDSGSPFQDSKIQGSGGLGSVSLQGPQRFGGSNKSPDQLEKHYSKTRRGDDTKFDRNTTNTRGGDDRGLIESMNKLTAALNAKNKPADGDKPGDIVKPEVAVKHDINVNVVVGGEVNTQDQRVKDIIKQETEQFKQNVENRIKALENKNDGLPPPPPAAVPTS